MKRVAYLKKVIRIRKALIKKQISGKQFWRCTQIIKHLEIHIQAVNNKNDDFWRRFINKYEEDIRFLIPENKAKETLIQELEQLL